MKITINLLPPEKKEEIQFKSKAQTVLKFAVRACFAIAVYAIFITACMQVLEINKRSIDSEITSIKQERTYQALREDQELIKDYYKMAQQMERGFKEQKSMMPLFEYLNTLTPDGVIYDLLKVEDKVVVIKGEGKERKDVLELRKKLEESGKFHKVTAPISNFVQDRNVIFEFNLELKDIK